MRWRRGVMGRRLVFMRGLLLSKTVTIAAWVSRCSQRSHCGPDRYERRDGRNDGEDGRGGRHCTRTQVTVDRRIAPPTAATERRMIVSCHAAPQYSDADHEYLPGDTQLVPGF